MDFNKRVEEMEVTGAEGYWNHKLRKPIKEWELELRLRIRNMSIRSKLYKVLKKELKARGNWKDAPRGNPSKGREAQMMSNNSAY